MKTLLYIVAAIALAIAASGLIKWMVTGVIDLWLILPFLLVAAILAAIARFAELSPPRS